MLENSGYTKTLLRSQCDLLTYIPIIRLFERPCYMNDSFHIWNIFIKSIEVNKMRHPVGHRDSLVRAHQRPGFNNPCN